MGAISYGVGHVSYLDVLPINKARIVVSRKAEWQKFRSQIIELDGGGCVRCGKSPDEGAILHVHHKEYIAGRDYWDYPIETMETLCAGCHAKEHGIISPDCGWVLVNDEDHGFIGEESCNYCGAPLRYSYRIEHSNWPTMDVGRDCCNLLTRTSEASERERRRKTRDKRRKAFVESGDWVWNDDDGDGVLVKTALGHRIRLVWEPPGFRIHIGRFRGRNHHSSIAEAKGAAYDAIEWIEGRATSTVTAVPDRS